MAERAADEVGAAGGGDAAGKSHAVVAAAVPTGRRSWLDARWRAEILAWAMAELGARGRRITGAVEQPHVRPWSTAFRIPTDAGVTWLKAPGPGVVYEGALLGVFRALGIRRAVVPFAFEPSRGWMLFDDASPTFRATRPDGHGDHDLAAWERILREYAELQRSLEGATAIAMMLDAGTPDGRPERLPAELARLIEDDLVWGRVAPEERAEADVARAGLRARLLEIREVAEHAAISVPASIDHDDFHGGNIVVGPDGDRFFDWGDAAVAHPFATLTATFNSIAHHTERRLDDPVFVRLRDVYTEAWTDVLPRNDLAEVARLAIVLGCIGKALAWERALLDLDESEMDGHGDSVAGWLMELHDRLEPRDA